MSKLPCATCGHPEEEHVPILGCMENAAEKGAGVLFDCPCCEYTKKEDEEITESYPLSRGD